ncbi:MAG: hypothetical protein ACXQTP_06045 [Candidatus Methanofastidiosia archaeon]
MLVTVKYPEYKKVFTIMLAASMAFYLPWLVRIITNEGSLSPTIGHFTSIKGILGGLLQLQMFNPILIVLGILGYRKMNEDMPQQKIIKIFILGSLPMLIFYGGRYWIHTMPLWAICIGWYVKDFVKNKKRVMIIAILMIIPSVMVTTMRGTPIIPSLTGTDASILMWVNEDGFIFDKQYDEDCEVVASFLEKNLAPDAIVHGKPEWVSDMIVTLTNLRTDGGAWWEVSSESTGIVPDAIVSLYPMENSIRIGKFYVIAGKSNVFNYLKSVSS